MIVVTLSSFLIKQSNNICSVCVVRYMEETCILFFKTKYWQISIKLGYQKEKDVSPCVSLATDILMTVFTHFTLEITLVSQPHRHRDTKQRQQWGQRSTSIKEITRPFRQIGEKNAVTSAPLIIVIYILLVDSSGLKPPLQSLRHIVPRSHRITCHVLS